MQAILTGVTASAGGAPATDWTHDVQNGKASPVPTPRNTVRRERKGRFMAGVPS